MIAASNYWMANLNLGISPWQVVWPRMVLTGGLGLIFAPINVAAYLYTPRAWRASAIALVSLLRNEGGSVGTSMVQTLTARRDQFHLARLGESLDPFNPHVNSYFEQVYPYLYANSGDAAASHLAALQTLDNLRQQQALSLSYFDIFWLAAVLALMLAPCVFLMKRSVAEKGAHIAAE